MSHWIQACPVAPVDGVCPEALIWVYSSPRLYLTFDEFTQLLPAIVAVLLGAWGIRLLLRQIYKR